MPQPVSLDEGVDNGPRAQFDKHVYVVRTSKGSRTRVSYTLKYPESDEDRIVARLNKDVPIVVPCQGEPTVALPHPQANPTYEIDWKGSSIVA
jgi:hypothetical protein